MNNYTNRRNYGGRMMTEESIEKARARSVKWRKSNSEEVNEKARAKYREPEQHAKVQAYRDKNKSRQQEYCKKYYKENQERLLDAANQYYKDNTEDVKKRTYEYYKRRIKEDPQYRLTQYMRSRVRNAIYNGFSSKKCRTFDLVGCTPFQLKEHLGCQFTDGMTWENYGEWHVDHIKPCAKFNLMLDAEQRKCFHYSNLQPLWAKDNISKGDKYNEQE